MNIFKINFFYVFSDLLPDELESMKSLNVCNDSCSIFGRTEELNPFLVSFCLDDIGSNYCHKYKLKDTMTMKTDDKKFNLDQELSIDFIDMYNLSSLESTFVRFED